MMGYEQSDDLHESREAMESLVLGEPFNGRAFSGGTETDHHDPLLLSSSSSSVDRQNPNPSFNTFLDPPSYAEAIFTSFDSSSNGHESPRPTSTSNPRSSDYIYITVADPQKEEELSNSLVPGGTTYFTYLITTRTNLPEYGGPGSEFSVRRRFRDVVTLADRLSESYRGFFIPLRPDKSVVEGQLMAKREFVEQRRASLEKYLRRLAAHPVIRRSEELRVFLEVKGKLPLAQGNDVASRVIDGAAKLPRQLLGDEGMDVNAKGGRDLLKLFKELRQSVTNDWGSVKPLVVEEDRGFLERKERLVDFEQQLSNVSLQVLVYVIFMYKVSVCLNIGICNDFGLELYELDLNVSCE